MLTIRLSRIGKRKKPMYRLIISEKTKDPYGRALEIFGSYNPFSKELNVKEDRIKYWLSQGAEMSATVNNLLVEKKVISGEKVTASKSKKKKKSKEKTPKKEKPAPVKAIEVKEEKTEEKKDAKDKVKEKKKEEDSEPKEKNKPEKEKKGEEKEKKNKESK